MISFPENRMISHKSHNRSFEKIPGIRSSIILRAMRIVKNSQSVPFGSEQKREKRGEMGQ